MWDTYNTYSNGHGGCCAAWSGDHSPYGPMGNYFCGNSSAGGWIGYNDPRGMPGLSGISGVRLKFRKLFFILATLSWMRVGICRRECCLLLSALKLGRRRADLKKIRLFSSFRPLTTIRRSHMPNVRSLQHS